jgi:hypothetical protein
MRNIEYNEFSGYQEARAKCNGCEAKIIRGYGLNANVEGGYESHYLSDGMAYKFDLCEECIRKAMDSFKIPPTVTGYGMFSLEDSTYEQPTLLLNMKMIHCQRYS